MAKHILVIDDQESTRKIISQMLRDNGYQVTSASDGEEGLAIFNQDPKAFDLILADINMPKIDGFEFLKRVKYRSPTKPVIFLTGINEDVAQYMGKEYQVEGIIKKPFIVEETLKIIEKFLNP